MNRGLILFFILLLSAPFISFAAQSLKIKMAIFDNPKQDVSSEQSFNTLKKSYLEGINTAIYFARHKNIYIEEKAFFHNENIFEIIHKAADVKDWQPNVIIGFHASNDFLMAKSFFGDQLTLSIAATDPKLSALPKSFYSLGAPDNDTAEAIIIFLKKYYTSSDLFITTGAENKESIDFAYLLEKKYKSINPSQKVIQRQFLTEDMNYLDMKKFMSGYQVGNIIVSMSQGYSSGINLMNQIAAYLAPIKPIFVTSSDNWGNDDTPQILSGNYDAYRIDTLSGGYDTPEYKVFATNYEKLYHHPPEDTISYVTYRAVMSFVTALKRYPPPKNLSTTQAVLWSYQQALKHNPNWFRPEQFIVYKLSSNKEVYFETLSRT